MNRNFILLMFLCATTNSIWSCNSDRSNPDVTAITIDLNKLRFDNDLQAIDTNNLDEGMQMLRKKYEGFLDLYINNILPFAITSDSLDEAERNKKAILNFVSEPSIHGLFDTVNKKYPDTKIIDQKIEGGLKYLKHYFPEYKINTLVYFISGLNNWTAITYADSVKNQYILGIGLDMYLGRDYPYYASVGIPDYISSKLNAESITTNAFKAIYQDIQPFVPEDKKLLEMIIEKGKEQYILRTILISEPEHALLGYTKEQYEWCKNNEVEVYNFFIKQNLLYETNWQKILRYVNEGPSSTGMPSESPGNIGTWLGYKIVAQYMERHPEISLQELIKINDAQKILQEAKYKPR